MSHEHVYNVQNFYHVVKKNIQEIRVCGKPRRSDLSRVCVLGGRRRGEGNEGVLSLFPYLI